MAAILSEVGGWVGCGGGGGGGGGELSIQCPNVLLYASTNMQ